ncbi:MAG: glycosyltransferase family 2 protein [Dermatophilaceae bacterium]
MTSPAVDVTVVVVTWQGRHLLGPCLRSLRGQTLPHRLVVVDNHSTDGTLEFLKAFPEAEVVQLPTNTGFAGGVAAALPLVQTRFVALLNNDATAEPTWLAAATAYLIHNEEAAAVSSRMLLVGQPPRINNAGVVLLPDGYGADRGLGEPDGPPYDQAVEVFGASGGAAVFRTLAVKGVGGLEQRYFLYYEDTDLSWRLRLAGWRIDYCPDAVVHHRHAASSEPGSAGFAFHTERNRLLTLMRCAPTWFATQQLSRFALTTVSLAVKRALGLSVPMDPVFSSLIRSAALASALRLAPGMLSVRLIGSRQARAQVLRRWRGATSCELPQQHSAVS